MHVPVMAHAAVAWLRVRENGTYVDCTAGAGGHAALIAEQLRDGHLIALDRDPAAVAIARKRLEGQKNAAVLHANYGELKAVLAEQDIARIDGALLDLGFSSAQVDDAARGFSFRSDGPLDMRLDTTQEETAADLLSQIGRPELIRILREYGDLKPAKRVADAILRRREAGKLETTGDLAAAVADALPFVQGLPEETRTVFQAVRMAVNDELRWLESGLQEALALLRPGGRCVVISFHSGEDRIVKNIFREAGQARRTLHTDGRIRDTLPPRFAVLTRKPVRPDPAEVRANPRAHSARLRAVECLPDTEGNA